MKTKSDLKKLKLKPNILDGYESSHFFCHSYEGLGRRNLYVKKESLKVSFLKQLLYVLAAKLA